MEERRQCTQKKQKRLCEGEKALNGRGEYCKGEERRGEERKEEERRGEYSTGEERRREKS